jgi:hypothetical protein
VVVPRVGVGVSAIKRHKGGKLQRFVRLVE